MAKLLRTKAAAMLHFMLQQSLQHEPQQFLCCIAAKLTLSY
jgi:hypothetical protein